MEKQFHAALEAFLALLVGLSPSALGAAVSLAYEKGITWTERFVQFAVGTCVSFFAQRAIGATITLNPFMLQAIAFLVGLVAFKATPKFISSCSDAVAGLPVEIRDRILTWFPKKKDEQ
jgi:hypothetical protein